MSHSSTQINKHLKSLQKHLADEHPDNPTLAKAVKSFRKMDYVGHSMGLLNKDESYATCVTWWPMIAVLGTFSAGKSTYINSYLNIPLQRTVIRLSMINLQLFATATMMSQKHSLA